MVLSYLFKFIHICTRIWTWFKWNLPTYMTHKLERTRYSYNPPVLVREATKEVFNPDFLMKLTWQVRDIDFIFWSFKIVYHSNGSFVWVLQVTCCCWNSIGSSFLADLMLDYVGWVFRLWFIALGWVFWVSLAYATIFLSLQALDPLERMWIISFSLSSLSKGYVPTKYIWLHEFILVLHTIGNLLC